MSLRQQSMRLARYNRAVVLDLIRRHGPISKSDLSERSGLAVSSVLNIVASLTQRELVRSVTLGPSTGGRPPALIELNPGAHFAVGINVRISTVEASLLDLVGDIVSETVLPVQGSTLEALLGTLVEAVEQVVGFAHIDPARVLGVGVGYPGPVVGGHVVRSLPGWTSWSMAPLADQLERALGLPVTLENDANLGALAEFRHGRARRQQDCTSLVYVYADYGLGAGTVVNGTLYRGCDGMAGELGHVVIDVDGRHCRCGNYGCLEAVASVDSIIQRVVAAAKLGGETSLDRGVRGNWDSVSFAAISDAVSEGDRVCKSVLEEAMMHLAVGISNVDRQFRPAMIVLGGQLFDHGPRPFDMLQSALAQRPSFYDTSRATVVLGDLGTHAPCIGAATLILERFFGVAEEAMHHEPTEVEASTFEYPPIWPKPAGNGSLLTKSETTLEWAGNLRPAMSRIRADDHVTVSVDVRLAQDVDPEGGSVKALLRWDRVPLFGSSWPSPKNSPMHLVQSHGREATYGVTLGALPPGKYEFAAHVLGANDIWVRTGGGAEVNGRIEVFPSRLFAEHEEGEPQDSHGRPVDVFTSCNI